MRCTLIAIQLQVDDDLAIIRPTNVGPARTWSNVLTLHHRHRPAKTQRKVVVV